jgi:hypothetical protein
MKKIKILSISIIALIVLSACTRTNEITYTGNSEAIVISEIEQSNILRIFFSTSINIEDIEFRVTDPTVAGIRNTDELYGVGRGETTVVVSYRDFRIELPVIVEFDAPEETRRINEFTPEFNFDINDNFGVNSRIIRLLTGGGVYVFHNEEFITEIDEETPYEISIPGLYTFTYLNANREVVEYFPYVIQLPEIVFNETRNVLMIANPPSYLRGSINGENLLVRSSMDFSSFGSYDIELYYIDYNNEKQIVYQNEFYVEPILNIALNPNEIYQTDRPLRIEFVNGVQELIVNKEQVNLNTNQTYIVRQTRLNEIEIIGAGDASVIYRVNYTNQVINDFRNNWFFFIPLTFISISTISYKFYKGLRK